MAEQSSALLWDENFREGRGLNRYPWDCVVTFVNRYRPRDRPIGDVSIVEIGCGSGSNLWFAAREGFQAAGIDFSPSAIDYARGRLEEDGLSVDLRVGDLADLPWDAATFDLAIDRGALTCCSRGAARRAVREVQRVLRPGGKFFCNPYSWEHSSRTMGTPGEDGLVDDITGGTLTGVGSICFYDRGDIDELFDADQWRILTVEHLERREQPSGSVHAEWRVVAERAGQPEQGGKDEVGHGE